MARSLLTPEGMMTRVLVVIPAQSHDEAELSGVRDRLAKRGIEVVVAMAGASSQAGPAAGTPVGTVGAAKVHELDGVIFLGGPGAPELLWGDRDTMQLCAGANLEHKPVGAVGFGSIVPAQASLLVGRDVASPQGDAPTLELRKHRARPTNLPAVETDNGIVTASGADSLDEFIHLFCDLLLARESRSVARAASARG